MKWYTRTGIYQYAVKLLYGMKYMKKKTPKFDVMELIKAKVKEAQKAVEAECKDYTENTSELANKPQAAELTRVSNLYTRFEITQEQVSAFPTVTNTFGDIGGVNAVIEYMKSSDAKEARALLYYWEMGKGNRDLIPFEAYVIAAKMTRKKFMQILIGEISEQSDEESVLLAAVNHKAVVQTTIDIALSPDHEDSAKSREILHKHRSFLPTPKTQQVNIHGDMHQDNRNQSQQTANIGLFELDKGTDRISAAMDKFNSMKVIESEGEAVDE